MKRTDFPPAHQALPDDITEALLLAIAPTQPPAARAAALRERILAAARATPPTAALSFLTLRATEGVWLSLTPLVAMKLLHSDAASRSFLLRMQPGGVLPPHDHPGDEECMVLEGEVQLGDIVVRAGDYHLAPKGLAHGRVSSPTGVLLFLRADLAGAYGGHP